MSYESNISNYTTNNTDESIEMNLSSRINAANRKLKVKVNIAIILLVKISKLNFI